MFITSDEKLLVSSVIGYMFKVIKAGKTITEHDNEKFKAIKHGDYDCFFALIGEPQPFILQSKHGIIKKSDFSQESGDCDVTMLFAINPSLNKFGDECYNNYGNVHDRDITNLGFCKCAAFEIAMRVQSNKEKQNRKIAYSKSTLENTIDELCAYHNMPLNDREILQKGRKFVNMVKGHKPHFNTWQDGINAFELAWQICNEYQLKICH